MEKRKQQARIVWNHALLVSLYLFPNVVTADEQSGCQDEEKVIENMKIRKEDFKKSRKEMDFPFNFFNWTISPPPTTQFFNWNI